MLATALALLLSAATTASPQLPLRPCTVQAVPARCGTLAVPENRDTDEGRKIRLRVVVVPARHKPPRADAFTYLTGGPGGAAASDMTASAVGIWGRLLERRDILLVDQRGTGGSHALSCDPPGKTVDTPKEREQYVAHCLATLDGDPTQYGTAAAADDLDAVRAALGYRQLNVYGTSYGATLAQVYLARHPRSVRTVVLDGGTLLDIPFFERFAVNGQRALDQVARRCAADRACARAFPSWPSQLRSLIASWNAKPRQITPAAKLTGNDLAGVVQSMTRTAADAAEIPLVVSRAAARKYAPLAGHLSSSGPTLAIMYWSIWCNESWVGLDAAGPWGTYLDGNTEAALAEYRTVCSMFPRHDEPASSRTRVRSGVPLLALVGGADPQDPVANLRGLRQAMPKSRIVIVPNQGHAIGQYGCLPELTTRFIERGNAASLDVSCARKIAPAAFALR